MHRATKQCAAQTEFLCAPPFCCSVWSWCFLGGGLWYDNVAWLVAKRDEVMRLVVRWGEVMLLAGGGIMWCDVKWCHVISCDAMCGDVMWLCDAVGCEVVWCDAMWLCDVVNWQRMCCELRRAHDSKTLEASIPVRGETLGCKTQNDYANCRESCPNSTAVRSTWQMSFLESCPETDKVPTI